MYSDNFNNLVKSLNHDYTDIVKLTDKDKICHILKVKYENFGRWITVEEIYNTGKEINLHAKKFIIHSFNESKLESLPTLYIYRIYDYITDAEFKKYNAEANKEMKMRGREVINDYINTYL